jgi:hypothetical protein
VLTAFVQALDDDYTLWALWVWIYCIVWWLIQDTCKVAAYWIMTKLNLFQINTAKLVNMREAQKFSDKPLARASAGLVEVCYEALHYVSASHQAVCCQRVMPCRCVISFVSYRHNAYTASWQQASAGKRLMQAQTLQLAFSSLCLCSPY